MRFRSSPICTIVCTIALALLTMPNSADAFKDYTAVELKQLMDSGRPVFLLNPLSEIEFNEGHIPGSVNIPNEEILRSKRLPKNKEMLIVTYCKGPK
ncbi:MAG: rhodanese-like domain-containing protein [Desulfobacteraceae bacterium]